MAFVDTHLQRREIEQYNEALCDDDAEWLEDFWNDMSSRTGYSKRQILDLILDEFNEQKIGKTNRDYYLSSLANIL